MSPKLITSTTWFNVENGKITEWGINEPLSPSTPPPPKPTFSGHSSSSATANTAEAVSPLTTAATAPSASSKPPVTQTPKEGDTALYTTLPPNHSILTVASWGDCSSSPASDIQTWKQMMLSQPIHVGPVLKSEHLVKFRYLEGNESYIPLTVEPQPGARVLIDEDAIQNRNPQEVDLLYRAIPQEIRENIVSDYAAAGCHHPRRHHVVTMYNDRYCDDPEKWFRDAIELTL